MTVRTASMCLLTLLLLSGLALTWLSTDERPSSGSHRYGADNARVDTATVESPERRDAEMPSQPTAPEAFEYRVEFRGAQSHRSVPGGVDVLQVSDQGHVRTQEHVDTAVPIPQGEAWIGAIAADHALMLYPTAGVVERARSAPDGIAVMQVDPAPTVRGRVVNIPDSIYVNHTLEVQLRYDGSTLGERVLTGLRGTRRILVDRSGSFAFERKLPLGLTAVLLARHNLTELTTEIAKKPLSESENYLEFDMAVTPYVEPVGDVEFHATFAEEWPHGALQLTLVDLDGQSVRFKQVVGRREPDADAWVGRIHDVPEGIYTLDLMFTQECTSKYATEAFSVSSDTRVDFHVPRGATVAVRMIGLKRCDFVHAPARISAYTDTGVLLRSGYARSLEDPIATIEGLPAGRYTLEAGADGQSARNAILDVVDGGHHVLDMVMVDASYAEIHASESDRHRRFLLSHPDFGYRLVGISPRRSSCRFHVPSGEWQVVGLWPGGPTAALVVGPDGGSVSVSDTSDPSAPALPRITVAVPRPHGEGAPWLDAITAHLRSRNLEVIVDDAAAPAHETSAVLFWRAGARSLAARVFPELARQLADGTTTTLELRPRLVMDTDLLLQLPPR